MSTTGHSARPTFASSWQADLLSGALVSLIALPLCLGIALASGYPAIAGILTAIVGGLFTPLLSNSELTIKGPAAGLITVALGAVTEFGFTLGQDPAADFQAYRLALGVAVVAGIIQFCLGLLRAGILAEFFPTAAVHGLLAAIGVIIIAKQIPIVLGVSPAGKPLDLLAHIPGMLVGMNPIIGLIGLLSMAILAGYTLTANRHLRKIPASLIVLSVAVGLGLLFQLGTARHYMFGGQEFPLGPDYLVKVPANLASALVFPDFSALATVAGWKYVTMYVLIGSLETLLSAKAVDMLDPWKRRTDMNRDLMAIGLANTLAALIGGLPMISEIVRSKANLDYGARTRLANVSHGACLLLGVTLLPGLISLIPAAALGAMLVFTGYRLAAPSEFAKVYRVGREQLIVFTATLVAVLATDLLSGIAIGIVVKLASHVMHGAPAHALVRPRIVVEGPRDGKAVLSIEHAAVFSVWIAVKRRIDRLGPLQELTLDLTHTRFVDHTVMEKLHQLEQECEAKHCRLIVRGLERHHPNSAHPHAARRNLQAVR